MRQIVERFRPQWVVLFGSYAYGRPTRDSDVDPLILVETEDSPVRAAATISAAIDHPFPLDIVVVRPADWAAYLAEGAAFARQAAERGLVLYEARDRRVG